MLILKYYLIKQIKPPNLYVSSYLPKRPISCVFVTHIHSSLYRFRYDSIRDEYNSFDLDLIDQNYQLIPQSMKFYGISFSSLNASTLNDRMLNTMQDQLLSIGLFYPSIVQFNNCNFTAVTDTVLHRFLMVNIVKIIINKLVSCSYFKVIFVN
jgi:hypothetical protein